MTEKKNKGGRPSIYTEELMLAICMEVEMGSNIEQISKKDEYPSKFCIYKWLREKEEFYSEYARARIKRAEARAERIDEYVRDMISGKMKSDVARVAIDAEKWQAGKENSKRYGDKLELSGGLEKLSDDQVESRLAKLLGKASASGATGGAEEEESPS